MTELEAWQFERYWGAPGPAPEKRWRCCARCGDYWPPEARFWANPNKRICQACSSDAKRGIWPRPRYWHQKNRYTVDGRLERRCCTCGEWKPLRGYYVLRRSDKPNRTRRDYPSPECITCTKRRHIQSLTIPQLRARLRAERTRAA